MSKKSIEVRFFMTRKSSKIKSFSQNSIFKNHQKSPFYDHLKREKMTKKNHKLFNICQDQLGRKQIHVAKGQITSEQNCGVLNFPKMQRNYC